MALGLEALTWRVPWPRPQPRSGPLLRRPTPAGRTPRLDSVGDFKELVVECKERDLVFAPFDALWHVVGGNRELGAAARLAHRPFGLVQGAVGGRRRAIAGLWRAAC
jgi:hypothetical protein